MIWLQDFKKWHKKGIQWHKWRSLSSLQIMWLQVMSIHQSWFYTIESDLMFIIKVSDWASWPFGPAMTRTDIFLRGGPKHTENDIRQSYADCWEETGPNMVAFCPSFASTFGSGKMKWKDNIIFPPYMSQYKYGSMGTKTKKS